MKDASASITGIAVKISINAIRIEKIRFIFKKETSL